MPLWRPSLITYGIAGMKKIKYVQMPITCDRDVGEDCDCTHWIRNEILCILVYNILYFTK